MGKPWYRSKTVWVNLLAGALAVLNGQFGAVGLTTEQVAVAIAVLNLVLRYLTTQPVLIR